MLKNIKKWSNIKKVKTPLYLQTGKSRIYKEPYGTVLIIAPWNYPFHLTLLPLVGAIAAGNTAVLKPSEEAPHTARVIFEMITEAFQDDYIVVVNGDEKISKELVKQRFDLIFYTGSTSVGMQVMQAASQNLTPVILELGGKSPTILLRDADVDMAAKRIVFGKFLNAGQTCVAPDYVMVPHAIKEDFFHHLVAYIRLFYGSQPLQSREYGKIINEKHLSRLLSLLEDQNIIHGGKYNDTQLEPTIIDEPKQDARIMQEEIFGPILPIIGYEHVDEVIDFIRKQEKPLALYLFGEDVLDRKRILENISFGGGAINDTIMHLASNRLPFGGVGYSGMGSYHGKASFDAFTHEKSMYIKTKGFDTSIRYKPVTSWKTKLLYRFLK